VSVYDFTAFKNSAFAESITYTATGQAAKVIKAVVFRKQAGTISAKSDVPIVYYPIVVEIDRTDITTVTENEDSIVCNDVAGSLKTFRVKKIIYSDAGCFKLGL
jgi:hypothetical protein